MSSKNPRDATSPTAGNRVVIDRAAGILTFTLDNSSHGNEVTGGMFDAMLAALRAESSKPRARVLPFGHPATFSVRDASARAVPPRQSVVNRHASSNSKPLCGPRH